MKLCDLCGAKVTKVGQPYGLSPAYQTKDVQEVCSECLHEIEDAVDAFRQRINQLEQKARKRWLPRLFEKLRRRNADPCERIPELS